MVRVLQQRYGLHKREDAETRTDGQSATVDPEQVGFAW
jgi:hypothetical protein